MITRSKAFCKATGMQLAVRKITTIAQFQARAKTLTISLLTMKLKGLRWRSKRLSRRRRKLLSRRRIWQLPRRRLIILLLRILRQPILRWQSTPTRICTEKKISRMEYLTLLPRRRKEPRANMCRKQWAR